MYKIILLCNGKNEVIDKTDDENEAFYLVHMYRAVYEWSSIIKK